MRRISRLLVANRGEIARRIIRTAHRMGIETVAVYSAPDRGALHVREATLALPIGGSAAADSYLRIDKLVSAARQAGADAVHPGYGFLSENAEFAQALEDTGLTWIGPPAEAIRTLANKARARQLARARGIPVLPGCEGDDGPDELLLEAVLPQARHVEVQVFADLHGNCIHLGERDCSVQRRHGKIIEETPAPGLSPQLRAAMADAAIELARAAGYVGAGTVEFLLDEAGAFYLMEMNTRLQVEHPVTEMVTGLDLVEWQLRIACGERLPCRQNEVRFVGHAIEARICAEHEDFTPHSGTVLHFLPPPLGEGRGGGAPLRFDHAIEAGLTVSPHDDPLLGKLISHAPTRAEAIARLTSALGRLQILGLPCNRRFLAAALRHPVFAKGEARIPFLAEHGESLRRQLQQEEFGVAAEAAFSALLPNGAASVLASPFQRPLRIAHRDLHFDVPLCEAEGIAAGQAQVAVLAPGHWHVQVGAVDLFLRDASFDPPPASETAGN